MKILNCNEWEAWLVNQNDVHILQMSEWGQLKEKYGWKAVRLISDDEKCGAQVLIRSLILGLSIAYIPKGPIGKDSENFWREIDQVCRDNHAIFLKVELDGFQENFVRLPFDPHFFHPSSSIQPRNTIVIDLLGDQETWLARMKQKTRYNIRLAMKKEIQVFDSKDIESFYEIMISTGNRDQFGIHSREYYHDVFQLFEKEGKVALFLASFQGNPLAGILVFRSGTRAWYFYGASNEKERNRMPAYLLQLKGMQWAADHNCTTYDLWGIPDHPEEFLEEHFSDRSDGLWGVYRFKRGFGGQVRRYSQAYDRVYHPIFYWLFQQVDSRRNST